MTTRQAESSRPLIDRAPSSSRPSVDRRPSFVERLGAGLVTACALALVAVGSPQLSLGVAVGGLLSVVNFYALRLLLCGILTSSHPRRQAMLSLVLMAKFGAMGAAVFVAVNLLTVDVTGLLLGVSLIVVSILAEGFRVALRGAGLSR